MSTTSRPSQLVTEHIRFRLSPARIIAYITPLSIIVHPHNSRRELVRSFSITIEFDSSIALTCMTVHVYICVIYNQSACKHVSLLHSKCYLLLRYGSLATGQFINVILIIVHSPPTHTVQLHACMVVINFWRVSFSKILLTIHVPCSMARAKIAASIKTEPIIVIIRSKNFIQTAIWVGHLMAHRKMHAIWGNKQILCIIFNELVKHIVTTDYVNAFNNYNHKFLHWTTSCTESVKRSVAGTESCLL